MIKISQKGYNGLVLDDYSIGLDTDFTDAEAIFISHAHSDHVPRNRKRPVFATPATAALMRVRGFTGEISEVSFYEPVQLPNVRVTLFPAGHILGSAMVFVESDPGTTLYTGDFRTPPSPASEGFDCPENVDYLITEATFSLPIYKWKPHHEIFETIREFARKTLNDGDTPVFLAYNLGKAQEIMMALAPTGLPVQIHGAGFPLCKIYTDFGYDLGNYESYDRNTAQDKVIIAPLSALETPMIQNIRKKKVAYCSGWAALESRSAQMTIDKLIPISDHVDFFELIDLCKKLSPKHVYITHTPNPDVVQHYLSKCGINSSPLGLETTPED